MYTASVPSIEDTMTEDDSNKTIGIDIFKKLMEDMKGDLIIKLEETSRKLDKNFSKCILQQSETSKL